MIRRPARAGLLAVAACLSGLYAAPAIAAPPRCVDAWAEAVQWRPGVDYGAHRAEHPRADCRKEWTVLIWMAGDAEDLVAPMRANLEALQAAGGTTADLDVLVLRDDLGPGGLSRLHVFSEGAAEVGGFADESRPPEELLRRFLRWGVEEYPADHYLVVLAGHGLGWRPTLATAPADAQRFDLRSTWGGFGFDATDQHVLDTPGLRRALEAVVDGPLEGRPFDVLLSDACLMQSLEVTTELADVARYIGGSEQVQPYLGLPYATLLKRLRRPATDPVDGCPMGDGPCRVGRSVATLQQRSVERSPTVEASIKAQYTYAVVDTSALRLRLLPAMAQLADALADHLERAPEAAIEWAVVLGETPGFLGGTRDIGALLTRIEAINPVRRGTSFVHVNRAAREARLALDETVVDYKVGRAYTRDDRQGRYQGMRGLAVWLPKDAADRRRRLDFFLRSRLHRTLGQAAGQPKGRWVRLLDLAFEPPAPVEQ